MMVPGARASARSRHPQPGRDVVMYTFGMRSVRSGLLQGSVLALLAVSACSSDDKYEKLVTVGDSLTQGVQTGTVFYLTQPNGYAPKVAYKVMNDADSEFQLPLL